MIGSVPGVNSVEYSNNTKDWFQGFQNFNVNDLIECKEQIWIATTNAGILSSMDERTWINRNNGLPQGVKVYQFQVLADQLYLETNSGVYEKGENGWVPCIEEINDYAKILTYQEKLTIVHKKGIWQYRNHHWIASEDQVAHPLKGYHILDAISNGKQLILTTDKGLFQYNRDGLKKLDHNHEIVQFFWLKDRLLGITKDARLHILQSSGWEMAFPYPFKVYNVLPYQQDQILVCTNKGLFTASPNQTKRIKSIFVCPNISKVISYKNKLYVGSYTNGLWTTNSQTKNHL